ncbi:hypothetical protein LA345_40175 (plasmid) [Burkholderia vietnamiensis]|uniref:Uncharacterized protein n=1 Tax=Burkholderia vietnamiensis (strain G4 / LMG 22486) TaxID=269482 RepID=A4JU74_BURVG|nr:hypothetical protein Bcep1808_6940 [Burkholderia vietnamiensis G4]MCB4350011.1 hypothetical protein [Burkholderia vietnamiensis]
MNDLQASKRRIADEDEIGLARQKLLAVMEEKFQDRTFSGYITSELAGDFAFEIARVLTRLEQADLPTLLLARQLREERDAWTRALANPSADAFVVGFGKERVAGISAVLEVVERAAASPLDSILARYPFLSRKEVIAFNRFCDCAEDGEGYDVPVTVMQRLSEVGLVKKVRGSVYEATGFGGVVRDAYTDSLDVVRVATADSRPADTPSQCAA